MVESTYRCRLIGEGIKPPKGAVVKSNGIERLGNDQSRIGQVRIRERDEQK